MVHGKKSKWKKILPIAIALLFVLMAVSSITTHSTGMLSSSVNSHASKGPGVTNSSSVLPSNESNYSSVNPENLYRNEPAPVGMADYGLGTGTLFGGYTPYEYNTTSFLGSAKIYNLSVVDNSTGNKCMSVQFNVNLVFNNSNNKYVYWVQDVAFINTSSRAITFIDNIWNMTSSGASMYNSTVNGTGTVSNYSDSGYYYSIASCTLPGNDIKLPNLATINFMVNSTMKNGSPEVELMYNDGYGWVTYDSPVFIFATNVTSDQSFVVDGYNYEPDGYSFYDAELILGGPGDGSSTVDMSSNIQLGIEYWNGHNYQEITNAFNYGSDTAETISNVTSTAEYYTSNGTIFENVTAGDGSLSQVYSSADISLLNISTPFSSGSISVNGTEYSFVKHEVNLTLAPGEYNLSIYNGTILYKNLTVNLTAGEYLPLNVAPKYNVVFTQTGLPAGTAWSVTINGKTESSVTNTIVFVLANDTYTYTVETPDKIYKAEHYSGDIVVNGSSYKSIIKFSKVTYEVKFIEAGLPGGSVWYVNLSSTVKSGPITGNSFSFALINGTYTYRTSIANEPYEPVPSSSGISVHGGNISTTITFSRMYTVKFVETGLPAGTTWLVTLNGTTESSDNNTILFALHNGTYAYTVSGVNGKKISDSSGNVDVNGKNVTVNNIKYTPEHNYTLYYGIGVVAAIAIIISAAIVAIRRKK